MSILQALWELALGARWFSGRSRAGRPTGYALWDWVTPPGDGPGIRGASLTVGYPDQDPERYFIPLVWRPLGSQVAPELFRARLGDDWFSVGELADDPAAGSLLLAALAGRAEGFAPAGAVQTGLPAARYGGEQSNTTLFFGDELLCKLFRRIWSGPNPDVELHEALADSGAVAQYHGAWRHGDADLAIFLQALPDPRDGYVLASEHAATGSDFTEQARALGEGLARIHTALASRLPTDRRDLAEVADGCRDRFEAAAAEVPELEAYRPAALEAFGRIGGDTAPVQRIHGDCHLGQVLLTPVGWRYVDFEGEPLRPLAERRRPDLPQRDVAGMLRSFDYASASAPDDVRPGWLAACRAAFLDGYGPGAGAAPDLLAALELDKAVYEVVYESRNRPAWRHVPLDSLARLARRG